MQLDLTRRGKDEQGEIAVKAFELSQTLRETWLTVDCRATPQAKLAPNVRFSESSV